VTPGCDADTDPTLAWISATSDVSHPEGSQDPSAFTHTLRHPNPFVAPGEIRFTLPMAGRIRVEIADATGCSVRSLFAGEQGSGEHLIAWDGRDGRSRPVTPGVYFLHVHSARGLEVSRMVVLR